MCKQNDVILILLYPNSTHILQVLDIAVFSPLKRKYADLYDIWKDLHPTQAFNELEFIKVLKATNDAVIKTDTIINGWRSSGLQPFNFSNINLDKLVADSCTNINREKSSGTSIANSHSSIDTEDQIMDENQISDTIDQNGNTCQFLIEDSNTNSTLIDNENVSYEFLFEDSNTTLTMANYENENESSQFLIGNSNATSTNNDIITMQSDDQGGNIYLIMFP